MNIRHFFFILISISLAKYVNAQVGSNSSELRLVQQNKEAVKDTLGKVNFDSKSPSDIILTVSSSGKDKESAVQSALKISIEQAFGAFISTKTELLNDKIIFDGITSISTGNIKQFSIIEESVLPNGVYTITLKAVVSIAKLSGFVKAKGLKVEMEGNLFAVNIQQQILNERNEVKSLENAISLLHEPMQTICDYQIETSTPKSIDEDNENWEIPIMVKAKANKNYDICTKYLIKTLNAISLTRDEVQSYNQLNKLSYELEIEYLGVVHNIFLRKYQSVDLLSAFIKNKEFYIRGFYVTSGLDRIEEQEFKIIEKNKNRGYYEREKLKITFDKEGDIIESFTNTQTKDLNQIKSIKGYSVTPTGVRSEFKFGGLVISSSSKYLLVSYYFNFIDINWKALSKSIKSLNSGFSNYSDWKLPGSDDFSLIKDFVKKTSLVSINSNDNFWIYGADLNSDLSDYNVRNALFTRKINLDGTEYKVTPIENESLSLNKSTKDTIIGVPLRNNNAVISENENVIPENIFDKYIANIGGKAKILMLNSQVIEGSLGFYKESTLIADCSIKKFWDGNIYLSVIIDNKTNKIISKEVIVDDKGYILANNEYREMNQKEFIKFKQEADLQNEINSYNYNFARNYVKSDESSDVLLYTQGDIKRYEFYDKSSGLIVRRIEEELGDEMAAIDVKLSDYKETNDLPGYLIPRKYEIKYKNGINAIVNIDNVTINSKISFSDYKKYFKQ
jgi:hypothetical protein